MDAFQRESHWWKALTIKQRTCLGVLCEDIIFITVSGIEITMRKHSVSRVKGLN